MIVGINITLNTFWLILWTLILLLPLVVGYMVMWQFTTEAMRDAWRRWRER